jgi:hypothetical protein
MVRRRAATATVTLSNCNRSVNNGTVVLNGQLVISSHTVTPTGTTWSGSVSLPNNAVTLSSGTVDTAGNIGSNFTLVNSGGARGGGTAIGTVGTMPGGAFNATFNGAFTVGEVCTISGSLSAP